MLLWRGHFNTGKEIKEYTEVAQTSDQIQPLVYYCLLSPGSAQPPATRDLYSSIVSLHDSDSLLGASLSGLATLVKVLVTDSWSAISQLALYDILVACVKESEEQITAAVDIEVPSTHQGAGAYSV